MLTTKILTVLAVLLLVAAAAVPERPHSWLTWVAALLLSVALLASAFGA